MLIIVTFSLLHTSLLWNVVSSLECYTGFSIIRGQTVGTTKEVCSKQSDSCYRAMADINLLSSVKKAGCSTLRCYVSFNLPSSCPMKPEWKKFTAVRKSESKLNRNKCIEQDLFGSKTQFCCCDDRDLCNTASTSLAIIISIVAPLYFVL